MEHPGSIFGLPTGPAGFIIVPRDNGREVGPSTRKKFVLNKVIEECFSKAEAVATLRQRIEEKGLEAVIAI